MTKETIIGYIVLIIVATTTSFIGLYLARSIDRLRQDAISVYQHQLQGQIEIFKEEELTEYDAGWNDALWNVFNLLEYK